MGNTGNLIDLFVNVLNERGPEPLFDEDVPPELRTRELDDMRGMYEWTICSAGTNTWVAALERKLPHPFPSLYHDLISRYRFAEFEIEPVFFFANTGRPVSNELSDVIFRDVGLAEPLLQHGFLQFGREAGGGYDPVCFAMARRAGDDAPIVRIDHEDVLIRSRIRVISEIAPSFATFVRQVVAKTP